MTDPVSEYRDLQTRRSFLGTSGMGLGAAVAASLINGRADAADSDGVPTPRAKRVIFLFMAGAPSQVDLFDYKPNLHKLFKTE
ncbi:MAG TPA: sulfatase, partial [Planctomycetaceae bacterium]|nr:sulfatase [Planctomycetaceae bacterium]